MIKHLVFWKINDGIDGVSKADAMRQIKEALESMNGKIPGLIKIESGINVIEDPTASDVSLYSEFESWDALTAYQTHPAHEPAKKLIGKFKSERRAVDFEV
jgi:hypothetical protein